LIGSVAAFAIDGVLRAIGVLEGIFVILQTPIEFIPILFAIAIGIFGYVSYWFMQRRRTHETPQQREVREQRPVHTHINVKRRREILQVPATTKKRMGNYVANSITDKKQAIKEADKLRSMGYWTKVYYNIPEDKWITYRSTWKQKDVSSKGIPQWKRVGRNQ
jgi:hypothetical protein